MLFLKNLKNIKNKLTKRGNVTKNLRLAFMGGANFSIAPFIKLIESKHNIVCCYVKAPMPAGRGKKIREQPLANVIRENKIELRCPIGFNNEEEINYLKSLCLDAAIVVSYGLILPKDILKLTKYGFINIHASILPKWRGASPIESCIINGDEITGVTIMLLNEGVDTGPIISKKSIKLNLEDNSNTLLNKLSNLGAEILVPSIEGYINGTITPKKQKNDIATYAKKIRKEDYKLDFNKNADILKRRIRAFSPKPGASCVINNETIKIFDAEVVNQGKVYSKVGVVLDNNLLISCKEGAIRLTSIQRPGKRAMPSSEVLRGWSVEIGISVY